MDDEEVSDMKEEEKNGTRSIDTCELAVDKLEKESIDSDMVSSDEE